MPIAGEVVTFPPKMGRFLRPRDRYIAEASRVERPVVVGVTARCGLSSSIPNREIEPFSNETRPLMQPINPT